MEYIVFPALAFIIDIALGDPRNAFHPVAWLGKFIVCLEKISPERGRLRQFCYGIFLTAIPTAVFTAPVFFLMEYLERIAANSHVLMAIYLVAGSLLLKSTFSIRGLRQAARTVQTYLEKGNEPQARFELCALVSRDTSHLQRPLLVSAAVESVAEGLCDSIIAPLFYYLLLGLPGAFAYRAINTLDAMVGYHGQYEYLGKFAARLDDVLNFIPARLAAFLLVLAALLTRNNWRSASQTAIKQHRNTASPNAGWPMAAMAGALEVRLEKPDHYVLGDAKQVLVPGIISRAIRVMLAASAIWAGLTLAAGGVFYGLEA